MNQSLPEPKNLISISQAAKFLGVSIDTIRRWDKSGVLHSERPDGKNRYFSLDELEIHKSTQPLSISEVAKKLNISATTLRRLEDRGLLKPGRNSAGERVYDKDLVDNFLSSDYFLRKKPINNIPVENSREQKLSISPPHEEQEENEEKSKDNNANLIATEAQAPLPETPSFSIPIPSTPKSEFRSFSKTLQRVPEFLGAGAIFVLLVAIGVTNINLSAAQNSQPEQRSAVLSETITRSETIVREEPKQASISAELTAKLIEVSEASPTAKPSAEPVTMESVQSLLDRTSDPDFNEATKSAAESEGGLSPDDFKITLTIRTNGADFINVRENPASQSAVIGRAEDGDTFRMVSRGSDWYGIKLSNQKNGFIAEEFAEIKEIN